MSRRLALVNRVLRLVEKPHLARGTPKSLRRSFEISARIWFRRAPGTVVEQGKLDGVPMNWVRPVTAVDGATILYFHGGGYVFGSADTHARIVSRLARISGLRIALPDYRLAPEHAFPAACEDAVASYKGLLALGVPAEKIILGGDSAGGGLALSLLAQILALNLPVPAGCFGFSPLCDLSFSNPSVQTNARADPMLPADRFDEMRRLYLCGASAHDPRASPIFADFCGAPPVRLTVSQGEILRDDTLRMIERLRNAGVTAELESHPNAPHVWPLFPPLVLPEAKASIHLMAEWIRTRLRLTGEN